MKVQLRMEGRVMAWTSQRNCGFVQCADLPVDCFVHRTQLRGCNSLKTGEAVRFTPIQRRDGRWAALQVRRVAEGRRAC